MIYDAKDKHIVACKDKVLREPNLDLASDHDLTRTA